MGIFGKKFQEIKERYRERKLENRMNKEREKEEIREAETQARTELRKAKLQAKIQRKVENIKNPPIKRLGKSIIGGLMSFGGGMASQATARRPRMAARRAAPDLLGMGGGGLMGTDFIGGSSPRMARRRKPRAARAQGINLGGFTLVPNARPAKKKNKRMRQTSEWNRWFG